MASTHTTAQVITFQPRRRAAVRVGPIKLCPTCRNELADGPIVYRCWTCRKSVRAADIDTEYHSPATDTGRAAA